MSPWRFFYLLLTFSDQGHSSAKVYSMQVNNSSAKVYSMQVNNSSAKVYSVYKIYKCTVEDRDDQLWLPFLTNSCGLLFDQLTWDNLVLGDN